MRIKLISLLFIIIVVLLMGCNEDPDLLTLQDITSSFSKAELHIKPQADDDYPKLNGIKPKAYELLDDSLYIYVFNSENELGQGLKELKEEDKFKLQPKIFQAKNILILYISLLPPDQNLENKINQIIQSIS